jgi:hypothetical protein
MQLVLVHKVVIRKIRRYLRSMASDRTCTLFSVGPSGDDPIVDIRPKEKHSGGSLASDKPRAD